MDAALSMHFGFFFSCVGFFFFFLYTSIQIKFHSIMTCDQWYFLKTDDFGSGTLISLYFPSLFFKRMREYCTFFQNNLDFNLMFQFKVTSAASLDFILTLCVDRHTMFLKVLSESELLMCAKSQL